MNIKQLEKKIKAAPENYSFRIMANGTNVGEYPMTDAVDLGEILADYRGSDVVVEIRRPNSGNRGTQFVSSHPLDKTDSPQTQMNFEEPTAVVSSIKTPSLAGLADNNPLMQLTIARLEQERDRYENKAEKLEAENKKLERDNFNLEKELKFKDKENEIQRHFDDANKESWTDKLLDIASQNPGLAEAGLGMLQSLMPAQRGLTGISEAATGIDGLFKQTINLLDTKGKQDMTLILEAIKASPTDIGMIANKFREFAANHQAQLLANQHYEYTPGT